MEEENNINNGCDQFTRPEEILELQKYLRAIKEDLDERTELGTDVVKMDPSYRAGEINLDRNLHSTSKIATNMNSESEKIDFSNAILGVPLEGFPEEVKLDEGLARINEEGKKFINKLPDTKDTINVERIERLEKVREKLVGADTNSPRELETYVEKLEITPERLNLGNELIKIAGESKEINLSQERIDIVDPKFIDSLGTSKENLKGDIPELTLGEGSDKIPFLETKIDKLSDYRESIEADQRSNQEAITLGKGYSSLPNDQGKMFGSDEELPDAVLSIPGNLDEINLDNTKINLPIEESKELSLSNFLDTIEGEFNEPIQLRRDLEKDGYSPQGLKNIDNLPEELSKVEGEFNTSKSLDTFLSEQGIIPGDINNIDNLQNKLPKDSYIEGELKDPNLSKELPEDGYVRGELKVPNLTEELPEGGYIEGELKDPNLTEELPEDGYIEGELKNIDELRTELSKEGHIKGEFEDIDDLRTKLPKKDGYVRGDFEKIDRLANKLPKKDGKVRGEFEKIEDLAHKLPKKDGYTRGDFKKIKNLTGELPEDGYVEGDLKEVDKLTKSLPEDGYVDGDFIDFEELNKELLVDGKIDGDFNEIKNLTEELPEDSYIKGDQVDIKILPKELTSDGQLDEEDLVEINKLTKKLPNDSYTTGKFQNIETLDKKISIDGKIDGDFNEIENLSKHLPEDGYVDGDFHNITQLEENLPKDGYVEGDNKEIKKLTKDLPTSSYIDGDFKNPKPSNRLPKDGHIGEDDIIEIDKLTKKLPEDSYIEGDLVEFESLTKDLPSDGYIEGDLIEFNKLTKKLPEDGHIGEEGIVDISKLTKELPEDGHIGEEGIVKFEELTEDLPIDGTIPGDLEEIYGLDASLPFDGHTTGDFKEIDKLTKELPNPDGYTQGDLIEISELDKALSTDGLIHGESEGPFSEETETEDLFQRYSSNNEVFSIVDGTIPNSSLPLGDDWEHTTPEEKFNQYTGKLGGIYIDPVTREVKHEGKFQISDGTIAQDTFPTNDPEGREGLLRRKPLNLDNKEFDEIDGLIPESTTPEADNWEHREIDHLDKSYDNVNSDGLIPRSSIPTGDDWKHEDPIERMNFYNKSKVREKSVDPKTKEREYKGEFVIEEGITPKTEIPAGDIWGHETFEDQFKLYQNSAVRIKSIDANGNISYTGNFKFDEGIIPENSRPKGEEDKDPKLYEWLRSLEKIDSGAGDLYHALLKRAGHDLEGYYNYLMHYADNKDLSSGWGEKLSSLLSELGGNGSINIDKYMDFDNQLSGYVMKYYKTTEGKKEMRLEQSQLPKGLDAYMTASGYLRYMADLVRSGYVAMEKDKHTGSFWSNLQGTLGLKEIMLDKILMELVNLRDKAERGTKSNRDRLPGGTGVLQDFLMTTDVWNTAVNLGRTFISRIRSNKKGSTHGDTTNPINRPIPTESSKTYNDNYGNYTQTVGWYDPHAETRNPLSGWDLIKSAVKDTVIKSGGQEINYKFADNYLQGSGIKLTLYDLADHNLDIEGIDTVEGFMQTIRQSPLITSPTQFLTTSPYDRTTTTLDTNNYWEVVIEPYLGKDNGFCSYLPSVEEINIINFKKHGVQTKYSRWLPIVSFDLSRSRTTTKSIGLFGGEFTIPGGIEYSNELRMTIVDDMFKSWRRYFEKCADVGVYNSRIHKLDFYGYGKEGTNVTPKIKKSGEWDTYKISKKDAEKITVVDKSSFVLAPYKNVTFRIRIYIMTPQYSTINKYDLLATLKEVSVERSGEIDPSSQDLEITFSIVGETNEYNLKYPTSSPPKLGSDWNSNDAIKHEVELSSMKKKYAKDIEDLEKRTKKSKSTARTVNNKGKKKKKK